MLYKTQTKQKARKQNGPRQTLHTHCSILVNVKIKTKIAHVGSVTLLPSLGASLFSGSLSRIRGSLNELTYIDAGRVGH